MKSRGRIRLVYGMLFILLLMLPTFAQAEATVINLSTIASSGTGYTYIDNTVTITANGEYTITGSTTINNIVIPTNITATIALNGVKIETSINGKSPIQLNGTANLTINLTGQNTLTSIGQAPGLRVYKSAALTIKGNGTLTVNGGGFGAAIGGGTYGDDDPNPSSDDLHCGKVTINSGTVVANAISGAGIGGGLSGKGGTVTINGGTITATGGSGAGIGGGGGGGPFIDGGTVTINGGTVIATSRNGGSGIGGGMGGEGGTVTINGGTVTASSYGGGSVIGSGIGGSNYTNAPDTYINGGSVKASSIQGRPQNSEKEYVQLGKLDGQSGVKSVLVDGKSIKVQDNHTGDDALYLYMTAGTHKVDVQIGNITTNYTATWNGSNQSDLIFSTKQATPSVHGTNVLSGIVGAVGQQTVSVTVADAVAESIRLWANIEGRDVVVTCTGNGNASFVFAEEEMNALTVGTYDIMVSSEETVRNQAIAPTNVGTLTITNLAQPSVGGTLSLNGTVGQMEKLRVAVQLTKAQFGDPMEFTLMVGDLTATAIATQNGELSFDLPADALNKLSVGVHKITVQSKGNDKNNALSASEVGTFTITAVAITDWSLPKTFKATKGLAYALAKATPAGSTISGVTFTTSNKKAVTVDTQGVITAKAKGKATITATEKGKKPQKCVVTVQNNSYARKKPTIRTDVGLFSSTKSLSYDKGQLKIQMFLYNRTGEKIAKATDLKLELYQDGNTLFSKPLPDWTIKGGIKHKAYAIYKLTLSQSDLPGVLDLTSGSIRAVLVGTTDKGILITPMLPNMTGVTTPKDGEPTDLDEMPQPSEVEELDENP